MSRRTIPLTVVGLLLSVPVHAQVIGTFRWQTQPYCNVVTITVNQLGSVYQLTGSDNLCGADPAPLTGTAAPSTGGVTLGFTVTTANGPAVHVSATIELATLSGTWVDSHGNSGVFAFGGNTGGSSRPLPTGPGTAMVGGNGEGVGNTICTSPNGIEVFIRNASGNLVDERFSFIVPEFGFGQIRADGSIRSSSPNLIAVQHPSPGAYCLVFSTAPPQNNGEATVVSIHAER